MYKKESTLKKKLKNLENVLDDDDNLECYNNIKDKINSKQN